MRKLEEFVTEKLKVTKNSKSGNSVIVTTLRKFLAWFTGEPDYTINKFDISDRDFISSDKKMTKDDKTNFLYKCLDAAIYVSEEEKSTYDVSGLNGEVKIKLYDYSFEVGNITFSIDARIYNENELLSKNQIAGCMVVAGRMFRDGAARLIRSGKVRADTHIQMLKRFKDDVTEVKSGYECGIELSNLAETFQEGDVIECYEMVSRQPDL